MIRSPHKWVREIAIASLILAVCSTWLPTAQAQTPTVLVRLLDQTAQTGTIVSCDVDTLNLQTAQNVVSLSVDSIESIKFHESAQLEITAPTRLSLLDGSNVVVSRCELQGKNLPSQTGVGLNIEPAKRNVRAIIFDREQSNENLDRHVAEVLADQSIAADTLIVLRKGDFNAIEGIVKSLGAERVEFSIGDQTAKVALTKVSAITFFKAGAAQAIEQEFSDPFAVCNLADGSSLRLSRFSVEDNNINAVSLCGEKFSLKHENILSVQFKTTTSVPISQLPPTTNDWSPLVMATSVAEPLRNLRLARFDQSFTGKKIVLQVARPADEVARGKTPTVPQSFDSGIAMHGGGRIAWKLGGNFTTVRGKIGFAPSASILGHVNFRVIVDGKSLLELEMNNSEMEAPEDFELDIEGRERMVFEVDYAGANSIGDIVHLADVVLEK